MKSIIKKYKSFIAYVVFGVLTTLVNIVVYNGCYNQFGMSNTVSNVLAWIMAVAFAYVTNKIWVFESKSWKLTVLKKRSSILCQLPSGNRGYGSYYYVHKCGCFWFARNAYENFKQCTCDYSELYIQ